MIGSQQQRNQKPQGNPTSIIITNSTFNYKSNHWSYFLFFISKQISLAILEEQKPSYLYFKKEK